MAKLAGWRIQKELLLPCRVNLTSKVSFIHDNLRLFIILHVDIRPELTVHICYFTFPRQRTKLLVRQDFFAWRNSSVATATL